MGGYSRKSWEITDDGTYCVQGYIRCENEKLFRKSAPITYLSKKTRERYRKIVENRSDEYSPYADELKFYESPYPFCDVIVISSPTVIGKNIINRLCGIGERLYCFENQIGDSYLYFITNGKVKSILGGNLIFSGVTLLNDKLVLGSDDIDSNAKYEDIADGYGNNSFVFFNNDGLRIGKDAFNMSFWFYSEYNGIFITANRYHAILKALKVFEVPLTIDVEKLKVLLSSVSVQFLSQNISMQMDVPQICQLEAENNLIFKNGQWDKTVSYYGCVMKGNHLLGEDGYEKLISESIEEIKNQLRLRHCTHFAMDLQFAMGYDFYTPLQSKKAMVLHHDLFMKQKDAKLQFDCIGYANPLLVGIVFDDKRDQCDINKSRKELLIDDIRYKGIMLDLKNDYQIEKWKSANKNKKEKICSLQRQGDLNARINTEYQNRDDYLFRKTLSNILELM